MTYVYVTDSTDEKQQQNTIPQKKNAFKEQYYSACLQNKVQTIYL